MLRWYALVDDVEENNILIHSIYIVGAFGQSLLSIRKYEVCLGRNNWRNTNHLKYMVFKNGAWNQTIHIKLKDTIFWFTKQRSYMLFFLKDIYFVCNRIINEVYILVHNDVPQLFSNMVLYINHDNGYKKIKLRKHHHRLMFWSKE